jgi:hypothetical protein
MAVRVETSTLEDEAAAGPTGVRALSVWVAWKRDTEVLRGGEDGGRSTGGVSGRSRSKMAVPGVEGGEMKATFFGTSVFVLFEALEVVPDVALRDMEGGASRSGAGARTGSFGEVGGSDGGDDGPEDAEDGAESRTGGGRGEESWVAKEEWTSSGSGLKGGRAAGSGMERSGCGGGGHCLSGFGWSFSFVPPIWRRWKKAFMRGTTVVGRERGLAAKQRQTASHVSLVSCPCHKARPPPRPQRPPCHLPPRSAPGRPCKWHRPLAGRPVSHCIPR